MPYEMLEDVEQILAPGYKDLNTVDDHDIEHSPEPNKAIALRTCSVSGKKFRCMTPHPSL
jgi:hypothetical protein